MNHSVVRINRVEIDYFKNVVHGEIDLKNTRRDYQASVLGLYGQNGSGKTALVDALLLLEHTLSGRRIPAFFADYIHVDSSFAHLKYELSVIDDDSESEFVVLYQFSIRKEIDDSAQDTNQNSDWTEKYRLTLFDEVLTYSYRDKQVKHKMTPIVDTKTEGVFVPESKYNILIGRDKNIATDLLVAKKLASSTSRSFIFSRELIAAVRKNCKEDYHLKLFESLIRYGNFELFIFRTSDSSVISFNELPWMFRYTENGKKTFGNLGIRLDKPAVIPMDAYEIVKKVVSSMNIVLTQLVPGLTIGLRELGAELLPDGRASMRVQMVSHKNNKDIPLQYESEGIKKIIAVLQLLIVMYNEKSITVVIDELDSGIFEYLLGELLRIISEKGKGQLVFTSHNLRPLETIDRGFIAFTTTNPNNRYIRMSNVKPNNNLRDFYYRDIILGEQSEEVYEPTNNFEIALAFREAGEMSGS